MSARPTRPASRSVRPFSPLQRNCSSRELVPTGNLIIHGSTGTSGRVIQLHSPGRFRREGRPRVREPTRPESAVLGGTDQDTQARRLGRFSKIRFDVTLSRTARLRRGVRSEMRACRRPVKSMIGGLSLRLVEAIADSGLRLAAGFDFNGETRRLPAYARRKLLHAARRS
jgi:hypothetical protein